MKTKLKSLKFFVNLFKLPIRIIPFKLWLPIDGFIWTFNEVFDHLHFISESLRFIEIEIMDKFNVIFFLSVF